MEALEALAVAAEVSPAPVWPAPRELPFPVSENRPALPGSLSQAAAPLKVDSELLDCHPFFEKLINGQKQMKQFCPSTTSKEEISDL